MKRATWWLVLLLVGCVKSGGVCPTSEVGPPAPSFECTPALEGAFVCSAGAGYACTVDQCWSLFRGGPCAEAVDAGPSDGGLDGGFDGGFDGGLDGGFDGGACGGGATCAASTEGAERCVGSTRERCEAGCWRSGGICLDGGIVLCNSTAGAPPVDRCTAEVEGVMICPGGPSSGSGYTCTAAGCWGAFLDGPCSPPYSTDGGLVCPGSGCTQAGQQRCSGRVKLECGTSGCWAPVGLCSPDGG